MNLEFLPNEVLLDLFEYFDGIDLLRAFYDLNSRFNVLLYKQYRSYHFQFRSVSKCIFDTICQQHLPNIAQQVIALRLSDRHDTPDQINLFCTYISSLRQFTHLRLIKLSQLRSHEILSKLLDECQHLCNFTHLTIDSSSFPSSETDFQLIINKIWSLPKLTYCRVNIDVEGRDIFYIPTIISTSLESIHMTSSLTLNQINRLIDYTPRLKYLYTYAKKVYNEVYVPSEFSMLVQCSIHFFSSFDISKMIIFLQNMINLRHLIIGIWSTIINGHQWEQIIRDYLPKIKTFHLKMKAILNEHEEIQQEADIILDSFRTQFWIHERQWFVECITWERTIYLYTVGNGSNDIEETIFGSWQSTCPQHNKQELYNNITSIYDGTFFDKPIPSGILLPNIDYLNIKLPINDQFWSVVSDLDQLDSLYVSLSHTDMFQSQLQTLLDRAPHLYMLMITQDTSLPLQMSLFEYTSASVRQVDLEDCKHYFNEEECLLLSRSSLGRQCELLYIWVSTRESIIHIVKNLSNLRSLTVKCEDDQTHATTMPMENNVEVIQWLKDRLPSTYSIVRNPQNDKIILIWM